MSAQDRQLLSALKEIFLHVADACDGGEKVPQHLRVAYHDALEKRAVEKFYNQACEDRSFELGL